MMNKIFEGNASYPDLEGKIVVVTGAYGGIGAATAEAFERQGAIVHRVDLQPADDSAERVHQADLSIPEEIAKVAQAVTERDGRIDVWINNAGFMNRMPSLDVTPADWDKTMDINLKATFFGAQAAARVMKDNGGGSIINVSSYAGLKARPNCPDYASNKAAVAHLTACLAMEWGELGIRVNAIAPGFIDTPMSSWMHADPKNLETFAQRTPLRRIGVPKEIADAMIFLASGNAGFVTGHTMLVDGGVRHG